MEAKDQSIVKCGKCGWSGVAWREQAHECDRAVQDGLNAAFWATVARDLRTRAGG